MTELDDVNIRHFKLTTGEDLIAIVLSENDVGHEQYRSDLIMVQSPMEIKMVKSDMSISFVFYDWQPLAKTDVCCINPMHIVSHVECSNDIKEQYISACVNTPPEPEHDSTYDGLPIYGPSSETYH